MCVTVINVGYGDAILFQLKNGYTALLDGGSALESEFEGDSYRIRSADYLARQQIEHLNAVIISHIHEDHVCGLEAVLQQTVVDHLYVPYPVEPFLKGCELTPASNAPRSVPLYVAALNAYRRILLHAKEKGIPVTVLKAGQVLKFGIDTKMRILAPKSCVVDAYMEIVERAYSLEADTDAVTECLIRLDATSNHTSMLLRFELGDIVFLSAADSCPSEWDEVPEIFFKNVNVLKLPHHGQIDSISESFMKNMPLEYIITTSASDRRYHSANQAVYHILGSGFTRFYAHITRIPYEILAAIVLTFCIAGAYSTNNRMYDIYIILIFGIVAYFLRRMDFQLVPILLGIVLGPLAEKNFRRALVLSDGSLDIFFTRPISCAFILIAVGSILLFAWKNHKAKVKTTQK